MQNYFSSMQKFIFCKLRSSAWYPKLGHTTLFKIFPSVVCCSPASIKCVNRNSLQIYFCINNTIIISLNYAIPIFFLLSMPRCECLSLYILMTGREMLTSFISISSSITCSTPSLKQISVQWYKAVKIWLGDILIMKSIISKLYSIQIMNSIFHDASTIEGVVSFGSKSESK